MRTPMGRTGKTMSGNLLLGAALGFAGGLVLRAWRSFNEPTEPAESPAPRPAGVPIRAPHEEPVPIRCGMHRDRGDRSALLRP